MEDDRVINAVTGEIMEANTDIIVAPASSPAEYIKNLAIFNEFVGTCLKKGKHYGSIPGAKGQMLYQSGAEIIGKYFAIGSTQRLVEKTEDFERGFFAYTYESTGIHIPTQMKLGSVQRSCNSFETKYLYAWVPEKWATPEQIARKVDRKENQKYKGSFDLKIMKLPHELAGIINTLMSMAQKRAHTAMVRQVTAASEFFQDEADEAPPGKDGDTSKASNPQRAAINAAIFIMVGQLGRTPEEYKQHVYQTYQVKSMNDLTIDQLQQQSTMLQKAVIDDKAAKESK